MDNPAQGYGYSDCGYSRSVVDDYHPSYHSTTHWSLLLHPTIQLKEGFVWVFFLKSVYYFTEMRLRIDRQMFKPGKTKILKEYCLQCSAEKDRRTWERKETGNRNYFNYVCLRQNNSCKPGTNLLNLSHAISLNIPHISRKLLCNTVPYTFLKKLFANVSVFTIYQDINITMLLTVVHLSGWRTAALLLNNNFPWKYTLPLPAEGPCLSPYHKLYLYRPVAFATVREEVLSERTKIKHLVIS